MGCFLNGCCFGDACDLPWGVQFPAHSVTWRVLVERGFLDATSTATMTLHPTQLYSSLNGLVLAALTAVYYRYRSGDGSVVALALMTYPVSRICVEILRGDEMGQLGTGLTISQLVSLGVLVLGLGLAWWSWTHPDTELPSVSATDTGGGTSPSA
jgi:phosphatidylglycerol:prolipoprotein diacylglycerol transferase